MMTLSETQQNVFKEVEKLINSIADEFAAKYGKAYGVDADDIAQELRIEWWVKSQKYDKKKGNIRAFANRVLRNKAKNYCRKNFTFYKRNMITPPVLGAEHGNHVYDGYAEPNPLFNYNPDIERHVILKIVSENLYKTATEEERAVLEYIMYEYDDKWSARQTALHLGINEKKVYRMLKRFRKRIGENPLLH